MANLKRPELKLMGNVSENFKNFELRFNDYCIQANYRDLAKDPVAERAAHYKSPLLEISALHSALLDEALSVVHVFSAVMGVVRIRGNYVQLMERPAPVLVATTVLPVSAFRIANFQATVPDPLGDKKAEGPKKPET